VLAALAVLLAYAVFVFLRPQTACRRCARRRRAACRRCKGTGVRFRLPARLVHRGAVMAMRYVREKRESE
jgi:hypothetical protein